MFRHCYLPLGSWRRILPLSRTDLRRLSSAWSSVCRRLYDRRWRAEESGRTKVSSSPCCCLSASTCRPSSGCWSSSVDWAWCRAVARPRADCDVDSPRRRRCSEWRSESPEHPADCSTADHFTRQSNNQSPPERSSERRLAVTCTHHVLKRDLKYCLMTSLSFGSDWTRMCLFENFRATG